MQPPSDLAQERQDALTAYIESDGPEQKGELPKVPVTDATGARELYKQETGNCGLSDALGIATLFECRPTPAPSFIS